MTLRGVFRELSIARRRRDDAYNAQMQAAWTEAALARAKKLPPLQQLLRRERLQTAQEQKAVLHMLAAQYGGRVRTKARVTSG